MKKRNTLSRYFATREAAEQNLVEQGFVLTTTDGKASLYPWNYGLVDADVRFNSEGFFIRYRA